MPDENEKYRSYLGVCLSIFTLILVIGYGSFKFSDLLNQKNYRLQEAIETDYYATDETFTFDDGLQFAAALTTFGGVVEEEDEEIATLKFKMKYWSDQDETDAVQWVEIPTKKCKEQDLNDVEDTKPETEFQRLSEDSVKNLKDLRPIMKCIDKKKYEEDRLNDSNPLLKSQLEIFGDYDSAIAANFQIIVEKCDKKKREREGKTQCKENAEIEEKLANKYIAVLHNKERFIPHKFGTQRMEKVSHLQWFPVSPTVRTEYVQDVIRTTMQLNDQPFSFGVVGIVEEKGFRENSRNRILPYANQMQNAITYELSRIRHSYNRKVYGFLDLLSDLGGLFSTIGPICAVFVSIFQFRGTYLYLASTMLPKAGELKVEPSNSNIGEHQRIEAIDDSMSDYKNVQKGCFSILCFNLKFRLPRLCKEKCCRFLQLSKKERMYSNRYRQLEKEVHVSHILKNLRVLKMLVKETLTRKQWKKAFKTHSILGEMSISSDLSDEHVDDLEFVQTLKVQEERSGENTQTRLVDEKLNKSEFGTVRSDFAPVNDSEFVSDVKHLNNEVIYQVDVMIQQTSQKQDDQESMLPSLVGKSKTSNFTPEDVVQEEIDKMVRDQSHGKLDGASQSNTEKSNET